MYAQFNWHFSKMTRALCQLKRKLKVNQQDFLQIVFSISKIHNQWKFFTKVAPPLQNQPVQAPLLQLDVTTAIAQQAYVCLHVCFALCEGKQE